MVGRVITTDSQNRAITPDREMSTLQGLKFGSFDVHLDERDVLASEDVIQPQAGNFHTRGTSYTPTADAVAKEVDGTVASADCCFVK